MVKNVWVIVIMKKLLILLLMLSFCINLACADGVSFTGEQYTVNTSGYSVTLFWPPDDKPDASLLTDVKDLCFTAYPAMRETYGTTDQKEVKVFFWDEDAMYIKVPAYTSGNEIHCSRQFLEASRGNLNCIVHELFHVVQNGYPQASENTLVGVLCEGLADVARYEYSVYDDPSWSLAAYADGQSYMDSYTVTAAFLVWINETYDEDFCLRLNRVLHEGTYGDYFWREVTGKTLDELWAQYAQQ